MNHFNKPVTVLNLPNKDVFKLPSESMIDKAKVKIGGFGPAFRKASIDDKDKVHLGGLGAISRS